VIEVIDQGEGISKEDQERIFHEFVQLGKTQLQDGTGLGLPISRRLAELLDGELSVESVVGQGSTFRLRLPQMADARAPKVVDQEIIREAADDRSAHESSAQSFTGRTVSPTPEPAMHEQHGP
jgi:hypothetical protein